MKIDYDKMYKDISRNSSNRIAYDLREKERKKTIFALIKEMLIFVIRD